MDNLYTLNEIVHGRLREDKKTYALFLDIQKAYDSVWHDGLWYKLWDMGVFERCSASVHCVTASHVHYMTLQCSAGSSDAMLALASYCEPALNTLYISVTISPNNRNSIL